jgi:hypothetical protein
MARLTAMMEATMPDQPSLIMIQFLTWLADRPRNYAQTMEAWRSSCPRLSVWEDAIIEGLVRIENNANRSVRVTARGSAVLRQAQPQMAGASEVSRRAAKIHLNARAKGPVVAHAAAF